MWHLCHAKAHGAELIVLKLNGEISIKKISVAAVDVAVQHAVATVDTDGIDFQCVKPILIDIAFDIGAAFTIVVVDKCGGGILRQCFEGGDNAGGVIGNCAVRQCDADIATIGHCFVENDNAASQAMATFTIRRDIGRTEMNGR